MMFERVVYDVVESGVAELVADPERIVAYLTEEALLGEEEAKKVRDLIVQKPPKVIHGYARSDADFPLYAVVLGAESTRDKFLGDEGGMLEDPDPDAGADEWASTFDVSLNVVTYAAHPEVVVYLYHLLRVVIIDALAAVAATCNLFDVRISGADLAPDASYFPPGVYLRRLTLSGAYQYTQPLGSTKVGRAWKVKSIHVDARGDLGADLGGVQTHATVRDDDADG